MPKPKNINAYPIMAYSKLIQNVSSTGKTFTSRPYPDKQTVIATRFDIYGFIDCCLLDPDYEETGRMGKSLCFSIKGNSLVVSSKDQATHIRNLEEDLDSFMSETEQGFKISSQGTKTERMDSKKPQKTNTPKGDSPFDLPTEDGRTERPTYEDAMDKLMEMTDKKEKK